MEEYISLSTLNDFIFCPYSIYLHNVYMSSSEDSYHSTSQTVGKNSHQTIDTNTYSTSKNDIIGLNIFSNELGIIGKIDIYKADKKLLLERKYKLTEIYKGQIYQLWGQYFCMEEMGYKIEKLAFYSISTNKTFSIEIPSQNDYNELNNFINQFKQFNIETEINISINKCRHCIYCNLCDKMEVENVYN